MTQDTQKRHAKKPGTKFIARGAVVSVLGVIFCIMAFSSTHMTFVPGTLREIETPGAPTPAVWGILILGLALMVIGFCKRLLAAVEK